MVALHDAGVCLLEQGKGQEARQTLEQASSQRAGTWRDGVDVPLWQGHRPLLRTAGGDPERAVAALRETALAEQKDGRFAVAAKLWESLAHLLVEHPADPPVIEDAFAKSNLPPSITSKTQQTRRFGSSAGCTSIAGPPAPSSRDSTRFARWNESRGKEAAARRSAEHGPARHLPAATR